MHIFITICDHCDIVIVLVPEVLIYTCALYFGLVQTFLDVSLPLLGFQPLPEVPASDHDETQQLDPDYAEQCARQAGLTARAFDVSMPVEDLPPKVE